METESTNQPDECAADGLTPKQIRFCEEYLVDMNATQAALRSGYSGASARTAGGRNMSNDVVRTEIARLKAARSARTKTTADEVLAELRAVAFARVGDVVELVETDDGQAVKVRSDALAGEVGKAVTSIRTGKGAVTVVMADKLRALEMIGRHLDMFTPETVVNVGQFDTAALDATFGAAMRRSLERDIRSHIAMRDAGAQPNNADALRRRAADLGLPCDI